MGDLAVKPYQGVRKDGAKGAAKGIGKGMANRGDMVDGEWRKCANGRRCCHISRDTQGWEEMN